LAPVFQDNRVDGICPEKAVPTALAPCQRSYACPMAQGFGNFGRSWAHNFWEQSVWRFRLAPSSRDPLKLFRSYFYAFYSVRARAFLPSFLSSCLPSFLARSVSLPSRQRKLNENPSIGDAFGKRNARSLNYFRLPTISGLPKPTYITSSTAQGGGGSFKNRKPIGEVGCCESRMAERIH